MEVTVVRLYLSALLLLIGSGVSAQENTKSSLVDAKLEKLSDCVKERGWSSLTYRRSPFKCRDSFVVKISDVSGIHRHFSGLSLGDAMLVRQLVQSSDSNVILDMTDFTDPSVTVKVSDSVTVKVLGGSGRVAQIQLIENRVTKLDSYLDNIDLVSTLAYAATL